MAGGDDDYKDWKKGERSLLVLQLLPTSSCHPAMHACHYATLTICSLITGEKASYSSFPSLSLSRISLEDVIRLNCPFVHCMLHSRFFFRQNCQWNLVGIHNRKRGVLLDAYQKSLFLLFRRIRIPPPCPLPFTHWLRLLPSSFPSHQSFLSLLSCSPGASPCVHNKGLAKTKC